MSQSPQHKRNHQSQLINDAPVPPKKRGRLQFSVADLTSAATATTTAAAAAAAAAAASSTPLDLSGNSGRFEEDKPTNNNKNNNDNNNDNNDNNWTTYMSQCAEALRHLSPGEQWWWQLKLCTQMQQMQQIQQQQQQQQAAAAAAAAIYFSSFAVPPVNAANLLLEPQRQQQQQQQRHRSIKIDWPIKGADATCRRQREVKGVKAEASLPASETDFLCSCGSSFVSLINFTLHLKETGHCPMTAYKDRDIPKLVRGQDMWINSETEQTREILRCIRCKQSFRTLPDLTMHMIKTKHYADIIYAEPPASPPSAASPPKGNGESTAPATGRAKAEVKEADSASSPVSTLQKMQNFVETSLPQAKRPGMFQEVLQNSFDLADEDQRGGSSQESLNYLSPDQPSSTTEENPLSSLQKLVDTAEATRPQSRASSDCRRSPLLTSPTLQQNSLLTSPTLQQNSLLTSPTLQQNSLLTSPTLQQNSLLTSPTLQQNSLLCSSALLATCKQEAVSPMDLTKSAKELVKDHRKSFSSSSPGEPEADRPWPESLMQKKARCQYCTKPFANKGQVRLHISKGKCPSLLSRVQQPVLQYSLDFLSAAARLRAAGLLPATEQQQQQQQQQLLNRGSSELSA